jgi:hypothetical protein
MTRIQKRNLLMGLAISGSILMIFVLTLFVDRDDIRVDGKRLSFWIKQFYVPVKLRNGTGYSLVSTGSHKKAFEKAGNKAIPFIMKYPEREPRFRKILSRFLPFLEIESRHIRELRALSALESVGPQAISEKEFLVNTLSCETNQLSWHVARALLAIDPSQSTYEAIAQAIQESTNDNKKLVVTMELARVLKQDSLPYLHDILDKEPSRTRLHDLLSEMLQNYSVKEP